MYTETSDHCESVSLLLKSATEISPFMIKSLDQVSNRISKVCALQTSIRTDQLGIAFIVIILLIICDSLYENTQPRAKL